MLPRPGGSPRSPPPSSPRSLSRSCPARRRPRARPRRTGRPDTCSTTARPRSQLDPGAAGALTSLGISVAPTGRAYAGKKGISFPITFGVVDAQTLAGQIRHAGGLVLTKGATKVYLTRYFIDIDDTPSLSGLVGSAQDRRRPRRPVQPRPVEPEGPAEGLPHQALGRHPEADRRGRRRAERRLRRGRHPVHGGPRDRHRDRQGAHLEHRPPCLGLVGRFDPRRTPAIAPGFG